MSRLQAAARRRAPDGAISANDLLDRLLVTADDLRAFLERRIPPRHRSRLAAEDLSQEVWDAAFRHHHHFVEHRPGDFWNWLQTIAQRKLLDAVRRANAAKRGAAWQIATRRDSSVDDFFSRVPSSQATPSGEVSRDEAIDAVRTALASLSPHQRSAIAMFHLEGRSRAEIADHMGASLPMVMNHLSQGRRHLRRLLAPDDVAGVGAEGPA